MQFRWQRIKGYTLTELMVGMIISVMVIAFALANGMFFSNRYSFFAKGYMNTIDFVQLKADLERSMQNSTEVFAADSTLTFYFVNSSPVSFRFSSEYTLRKYESTTDTIKIPTSFFTFEVQQNSTLVSSFSIIINVSKPNRYTFSKEYPVATMVRNYINASSI